MSPVAEVVVDTPIGPLLLVASEGALTHVWFDGLSRASTDDADLPTEDAEVLGAATVQLAEYFAGERRSFDLPLRVLYQVVREPYAFAKPGTYSLRLSYSDETVCPDGTTAPTLTIKVADPKGPDLAVWNAIKDCKRCAHLLHTGRAGKNQAGQDAVDLLRGVANQYPTSAYTALIRARLAAVSDDAKAPDADRTD